jgi:hypothetical protein
VVWGWGDLNVTKQNKTKQLRFVAALVSKIEMIIILNLYQL